MYVIDLIHFRARVGRACKYALTASEDVSIYGARAREPRGPPKITSNGISPYAQVMYAEIGAQGRGTQSERGEVPRAGGGIVVVMFASSGEAGGGKQRWIT